MASTYSNELSIALEAARQAARVCRRVQANLVTDDTLQKKDRSPVTVADFASQAVVCAALAAALPDDPIVGEEAAAALRHDDQATIREAVVRHVRETIGEQGVSEAQVLDWIDRGNADGSSSRYWTLDPIDGTKGFLRGEQYAVALALIENHEVVLGVLACPNLTFSADGIEEHADPPKVGAGGMLISAVRGEGAFVRSLHDENDPGAQVEPSALEAPSHARFCESVESGHSDQDASVRIARRLGITAEPVRMDSQCKYAAVARGDASIYLRLPTRADYVEKIWDHAAGMIVVEEAGGTVTDITGKPLDFSHGALLKANCGIIATTGDIHAAVVDAVRAELAE